MKLTHSQISEILSNYTSSSEGFVTLQSLIMNSLMYHERELFVSENAVVSLKVCNSSFLSLYFHCYFILFFPVFELIYSPFICRLCFLHRHGCQEEDDRLL